MKITELLSQGWRDVEGVAPIGSFLRRHGVDLCALDPATPLERGTPVYVRETADALLVQRRMAQVHVRMLFVLAADDRILGVVDLVELAGNADAIAGSVA